MAELQVPRMDFSILGDLMNAYKGAQRDATRQRVLAESGGNIENALTALIKSGDIEGAAKIGSILQAQQGMQGVYGTPIYGEVNGKPAIGSFDKRGNFKPIDTGGFQVTPGIKTIETPQGTYVVGSKSGQPVGGGVAPTTGPAPAQPGQPAPTGQPAAPQAPGFYPADNRAKARDVKIGGEEGEAHANLAAMRSKLPGLMVVVKKLGEIGDQATYTTAGQVLDYGRTQLGMDPRKAAIARTTYIAMVDNQVLPLLRETFGAQFTQKEGESLKTTLGDPNKTPQEKRAVLDAFIEQKIRNVESLERQSQSQAPPQAQPQQAAPQAAPQQQFQNGMRAQHPDGRVIEFRNGQWVPVQ